MTERNLATSINVMERVHKRNKNNNNDDPIEKLKTNITLIYDKNTFLSNGSEHLCDVVDTSINKIKAEKIHPLAFILGYEILNKNNLMIDISKKNKLYKKSFTNYNDAIENVEIFDIIRYARFYKTIHENIN